MHEITIRRYRPEDAAAWDTLVDAARNGTMLHRRAFMDYHADRFADHSLLACNGERLIAALPANADADTLVSHGGLTYGGWLMPERHIDAAVMLDVFEAAVDYLRRNGFARLVYRPVPHIFHRYPCEEDIYALWRMGASLSSCNVSTVVDLQRPLAPDRGCRSAASAAARAGVTVESSTDFAAYWALLADVLRERYNAAPVHSLDEITLLHSRFPDNIRLYTAMHNGAMVAGTVMFLMNGVARCQYIAANDDARRSKALTLLMTRLLDHFADNGYRYFDFGTSNEQGGRVLNRGLVEQKSRLGGRGIVYPTYALSL